MLFESGTAGEVPGAPVSAFETTYEAWPPPTSKDRTFYLGADGALAGDQARR